MTLHHSLPLLEIRASAQGLIEGYASVFGGVDSYGDTIIPGAFQASIAEHHSKQTMPVMLWSHKGDAPIGRWTSLKEDARGLAVAGHLNLKTSAGKDAFEHLQAGDLNGLSIGYRLAAGGSKFVGGVRHLTSIDLHEVSVVAMPADARARITSVKQDPVKPSTLREFEEALMGLGYSRREARSVAAKGYAAANSHQSHDELVRALTAAARAF